MALTIKKEILSQTIGYNTSYCYLFEPLKINISEDDILGTKIYIDLEIVDTTDVGNIIETVVKYAIFDINPLVGVKIDLMKIAQQYHDAGVYIYQSIEDIIDNETGWHSVVSKYKYNFLIYSDVSPTIQQISKLPIIGGRDFKDFEGGVYEAQDLTEAEASGMQLTGKWIGYPVIYNSLVDPTANDARPSVTSLIQTTGCSAEGFVVYKSRLGGWMVWGFDVQTESNSGMYSGNLDVGMFEATKDIEGDAYIPVDYTGITSTYSYQMKAFNLINADMRATIGVHSTPAIYYYDKATGRLELMRKTSASTPISTLSAGGDFSLSLSSISVSKQKTK
jgi:hypothetical protein